jgi:hypothetical protein
MERTGARQRDLYLSVTDGGFYRDEKAGAAEIRFDQPGFINISSIKIDKPVLLWEGEDYETIQSEK